MEKNNGMAIGDMPIVMKLNIGDGAIHSSPILIHSKKLSNISTSKTKFP
jgi:hypothetical protein